MSPGPTTAVSGRYLGLDVGQAPLVGVQRHLRPVGQFELAEDVGDVGLHRALADLQLARDLLVGSAVRDQLQYLALSRGEVVVPLGVGFTARRSIDRRGAEA